MTLAGAPGVTRMVWQQVTRWTKKGPATLHTAGLVVMVLETSRPSDEAVAFERAYGHGLPLADRAETVGTAWRQISRTLHVGNAEMVLSANP